MPDEMGLDTSIPPATWKEPEGQGSEQQTPQRRRRPATEPPKPSRPARGQPDDGVGTKIDVVA